MELTIEQALQQGVAAHKEGRLQDAERLYRAILQSQPLHPDANHNLGVLAVSVNRVSDALPLFESAIEANPNIAQFWASYIDALVKEKQFDKARQAIQQATQQGVSSEQLDAIKSKLASSPEKEKAQGKRPSEQKIQTFLKHYQIGQYDIAEKLAIEFTQDFPRHQFGWKALAAVLRQTGRTTEAVKANQKAVELSPEDAEAHSNLGVMLKELGRLEEAEASYTQAIALKPDYAEAHNNLGSTLMEMGRLNEAEDSYLQAIALKPDYAEAHNNLGSTLKGLNRLDEAEARYRKAIALKSDFAEAYSNLGATLQELAKLDEAEASLRQAIALRPEYAEAHCNLGVTLQQLGRLDEAEASCSQAIALRSDYAEAHSNLGNTFKEMGRLDQAEACYRKAIALKSDFAETHSNLGVTLLELGRPDAAEDSLTQAITLNPDFAEAMLNLSAVLDSMNKPEAAMGMLRNVLQLDSDDHALIAGVRLAVLLFLEECLTESKKHLVASAAIQERLAPEFRNDRIYQSYLLKILNWHEAQSDGNPDLASYNNLYVIGESHCLTSHLLKIRNSRGNFIGRSRLIMGCKQWHLGNPNPNKYKYKFESVLNSLEKSSEVLVAIGEIDCRLDSGIIPHKKKCPEKSRDEMIKTTVENFLNYISEINLGLDHKLTIQGVPCPNIPTANYSKEEIDELVEVIEMFNFELESESMKKGYGFLNVHKLTNRGDGLSNAIWHIDEYHLSPEGIQEAWCKYPGSRKEKS